MKKDTLILILFITLLSQSLFAQEAKKESDYPSPKRATIYSAVLPGAGQFYNKKYWKIPIIYGLGGLLIYNYTRFDAEYDCYDRAINDKSTCTDYGVADLDDSQIEDRQAVVRRNRDLQVILLVLTYVANIVDANVDAHLNEFDIGSNASASINPIFNPVRLNGQVNNTIGLNINLKF